MTPESAARKGLVPVGPISRVMQGTDLAELADETGIDLERLRKIRNGKKDWLSFDNADKIVTTVDPLLWIKDPELRRIYQGFDFTWLDRSRPTTVAA